MTRNRARIALLLLASLGGCVAAPTGQAPAPQVQTPRFDTHGLESVMGQNARHLERLLGDAELDVREGPARKLQFASAVCVLDAYLYPPRAGADPVVTYVDARLPDGRDMDRASCVAALTAARR